MKKYIKVVSKFYDNGKVKIDVSQEQHVLMPKNRMQSHPAYDVYEDYFGTQREADEFLRAINPKKEMRI